MKKEILNLSSTKADKRGQAIFKLVYSFIGRSLEFFALQKIGMTGLLYLLMSTTAHAECVPTPDCASIGYTEMSCETASIKCPFDTSKLKCLPCDSTFRYSCSGDNITGSVGSSCNGKYAECACSTGAIFVNGQCVCDTSCKVGAIYFSDGTCASVRCYDRLKTAIGVVVKDNELVLSQISSSTMKWGTKGKDLSLDNLTEEQAKEDFNGKTNTATIIAEDTGAIAAKYCNDYTTAGTNAGDWYLPAAGELYSYVYGNYSAINPAIISIGGSSGRTFLWSSSEIDSNYAWNVTNSSGNMYDFGKGSNFNVSCLLAIN